MCCLKLTENDNGLQSLKKRQLLPSVLGLCRMWPRNVAVVSLFQRFDALGSATGRASGLLRNQAPTVPKADLA